MNGFWGWFGAVVELVREFVLKVICGDGIGGFFDGCGVCGICD